jgi:hypothetical protein
MAEIRFEVRHEFDAGSHEVWGELVDWKGHAAWIPMTRMEVEPGDPTAVGAEFTAFTGIGPVALKDHMRVVRCDWDESSSSGDCEVEKLGPVLQGRAGFTVIPGGDGAVLDWFEDVRVPYTPQFLAPILNRVGAGGFRAGMRKLASLLAERRADASH